MKISPHLLLLLPRALCLYIFMLYQMRVFPFPKHYKPAMADVADSKITIKLLIDGRSQKVLFGEAGKDFVDFLFSLLALPLASVIKLLSPPSMMGSIEKLYKSVENLNETYLVANRDKSSLLQPKVSTFDVSFPLLLGPEDTTKLKYYLCNFCNRKVSTARNILCPTCKNAMVTEVNFVVPSVAGSSSTGAGSSSGFVKEVITYMITDNLEVTPMSAISSITLINRFNVKDAQFEEKVAIVGMKEGLALLKASLESPTVLSDVFCSSTKNTKA